MLQFIPIIGDKFPPFFYFIPIFLIIIILLLKKVGSARLRESTIHPIRPKTPAPQYQPIDRKKRKGKKVEV